MSKFQIGNILSRTKITQIRAELIEQLRASVIHMIHTPDGARCGLHCIWFGSAKDRKLILKTIKEFIEKVLTAEYGHLLVLGTIDSGKFQTFLILKSYTILTIQIVITIVEIFYRNSNS